MLYQIGLIVLCLLWLLLCLRFYTMISRHNLWQRRSIAIGAGVGAGLIYLVGSMFISILRAPPPDETPSQTQAEDVRIHRQ